MSFRKRHPIWAKSILGLLDGGCFTIAYAYMIYITRPQAVPYLVHARAELPSLLAALAVWFFVAFRQRLFFTRRGELLVPQLFYTTRVLITWLVLTVFLTALAAPGYVQRDELIIFSASSIVLVLLGRSLLRFSVWDLRRRGYNSSRILIVGANQCTQHLVETIRANEQFGWQIEGFLDDDASRRTFLERHGIPYLGKISELDRLLVQRVIDGVYVNLPLRSSYSIVQNIVNLCEGVGVPVRMVAELFPLRVGWTDVRRIADVPVVSLVSRPSSQLRMALKRATEWLIASALLALLSPVFLIIALAIRLTSGGPVLLQQLRLSRDRLPFFMLAFRTTDTPEEGKIASSNRLGRFLRRYGLDELPQLINVWRGEMALVGARPLQPAKHVPQPGCPRCWPEREPGLMRLFPQMVDEHPAAEPDVERGPAVAMEAADVPVDGIDVDASVGSEVAATAANIDGTD